MWVRVSQKAGNMVAYYGFLQPFRDACECVWTLRAQALPLAYGWIWEVVANGHAFRAVQSYL